MNKRFKSILFWAGVYALIFVVGRKKSFFVVILWILVWGGFLELIHWLSNRRYRKTTQEKAPANPDDPRLNTPKKAVKLLFNYQISNLLFLLNPLIVTQSLLQILGSFWEKAGRRAVLVAAEYPQKVNYSLPVAGEWQVFNGGVTEETSHSWDIPSQRFAYDLVKHRPNGLSFKNDGRQLADYFCFDQPILAPADGVVIRARDGRRDAPHVGTFWMDWLARDIGGNSVLIRHAEGEYCLLAHLRRGSVCVKAGQTVTRGQEIGRCGHSGNSTEPHLHFQFQNGKSFYFSSGLPVKFSGFWRYEGGQKVRVELDYITKQTTIAAE